MCIFYELTVFHPNISELLFCLVIKSHTCYHIVSYCVSVLFIDVIIGGYSANLNK